ncbi:MAG: restriction endonuclease subunit S [Chryseotalea sp.]|jgi:type I restriction enzyme S subunit
MKSNYKRLGDYIETVKVRNSELKAKELLGININKHFMPSVANIVGTDLSNYKLVQKNQFACNRMHVGRDYRIPVAVSEIEEPFIVSPAYDVFEIKDSKVLLPEYLMMWFERAEFDRNAWFYTDADVRGGLAWQAFEDMQLPIPQIEKQREIVKEYNTIQNRIALNQQLIQKLEETAQTIYRNVIEGNQCEEYSLKDLCLFQEGYVNPSQEFAKYFDGNVKWLRANDVNGGFILNTSRTLTEEGFNSAGTSALLFSPQTIVITKSGTIGRLGILCDYMCGNRAVINIKPKEDDNLPLIFFFLKSKYNELVEMAVGSAQANLYVPILASLRINLPDKKDISRFNMASKSLLELMKFKTIENQKLIELKALLLSKLATAE